MKTIILLLLLISCNKKIKVEPVKNFDINRYLGKWYEIARIDQHFEKGCKDASASYLKQQDGSIKVINKCFINGKEKISLGKAYFNQDSSIGSLKVIFFWPFYGTYNIAYLDKDYQYALILSDTKDYFWILSRTKTLDKTIINNLVEKSQSLGINKNNIIYNNEIE